MLSRICVSVLCMCIVYADCVLCICIAIIDNIRKTHFSQNLKRKKAKIAPKRGKVAPNRNNAQFVQRRIGKNSDFEKLRKKFQVCAPYTYNIFHHLLRKFAWLDTNIMIWWLHHNYITAKAKMQALIERSSRTMANDTHRMQISLPEKKYQQVKDTAAAMGVSMSAYINLAIAAQLARDKKRAAKG